MYISHIKDIHIGFAVRKHVCVLYMPEYNLIGVTTEYLNPAGHKVKALVFRVKIQGIVFHITSSLFSCTAVRLV